VITEHYFRREAGKIVAGLTRLLGSRHLDLAEDVVQETFLRATTTWPYNGVPQNPAAWLRRVARNLAVDQLRRDSRIMPLLDENAALLRSEWTLASTLDAAIVESRAGEDLLRMLFACCHPDIPAEHHVALALKTLCNLSVREIARAFVTNEEAVQKRLYRARLTFRELGRIELPGREERASRIDGVLRVLYLLFNEGYFSTESDEVIREDLLEEAVRLCDLLTQEPATDTPQVRALLALMLFHAARSEARLDSNGAIVLLSDQDRRRWDYELIALANRNLEKAFKDAAVSHFHLEAGIAAIHATARTWADTDWNAIVMLYDELLHRRPDVVIGINRAVAVSERDGAASGLHDLDAFRVDGSGLAIFHAVRGVLLARIGETESAYTELKRAADLTRNRAAKALFRNKLLSLGVLNEPESGGEVTVNRFNEQTEH
jgi:RNA polymerase sigma factor (sigma-70 family)